MTFEILKKNHRAMLAAGALAFSMGLVGCENDPSDSVQDAAENVGDAVGDAVEKSGDAIKDATN